VLFFLRCPYEITRYGSRIVWAKRLRGSDVAKVLEQTLNEEKAADKKFTTIAESKIKLKAAQARIRGRGMDALSSKRIALRPRSAIGTNPPSLLTVKLLRKLPRAGPRR
jgi:Domain of unknown function (DUF892)